MRPVALIGPMAAGKSSVGRKLASHLGATFVDTDREIVRAHGPIADLFEARGEPAFRAIEAETVAAALVDDAVVSLGGGAPLAAATQERLADAHVVLLMIDDRQAERRIAGSARPLLSDGGIDAWRRILAEREPTYRALADLEVDASRRKMSDIVAEIATWLEAKP
ncbi:shikimate kinase [Agrococcus jejuensis]|uniref:Shikimate kinase n=1 Tax=Agrococcus jejuensis TaxID=399736 RepID=A0A1G7ZSK7_9MICO|nr:shikimate kinase [Agrococcus jejuensis]SDH11100.1 shikimate kinase [Agrococcus jejuensis]